MMKIGCDHETELRQDASLRRQNFRSIILDAFVVKEQLTQGPVEGPVDRSVVGPEEGTLLEPELLEGDEEGCYSLPSPDSCALLIACHWWPPTESIAEIHLFVVLEAVVVDCFFL